MNQSNSSGLRAFWTYTTFRIQGGYKTFGLMNSDFLSVDVAKTNRLGTLVADCTLTSNAHTEDRTQELWSCGTAVALIHRGCYGASNSKGIIDGARALEGKARRVDAAPPPGRMLQV